MFLKIGPGLLWIPLTSAKLCSELTQGTRWRQRERFLKKNIISRYCNNFVITPSLSEWKVCILWLRSHDETAMLVPKQLKFCMIIESNSHKTFSLLFFLPIWLLWRQVQSENWHWSLTYRFHVEVGLFSNRSQMTSKCGKNKKVAHEAIAECVTDVLTTFWRLLWSITEQTHGNMESICFI